MRPTVALLCACLFVALPASAQMEDVVIETTPLTDSLHMLTGQGGNLVVCSGDDGVFLVDDQYAPLTDRIRAAISEIHDGDVRFVLNTHWHADHTGGNENFGEAGSVIVAHDNVRERMSVDQFNELFDRGTPASPPAALPVVTFADGLTFHLNGQTIEVIHFAHAHTDGDAIVHFVDDDVIHTGDIVFWGLYPFIDVDSGGSVDGVIAATGALLDMSGASTRFVPGHGTVLGRQELTAYRDMLVELRATVAGLLAEGRSEDEIVAAAPTADYDAEWGQVWLDGETFTRILCRSLTDGS